MHRFAPAARGHTTSTMANVTATATKKATKITK
jgi:hypothetical protein